MIETIRQGLKADGIDVSMSKLCQWFEVPRRTVYYQPTKAAPKVDAKLAEPIKAMIEENPSFGYRTVAHLLDFNKNTVQRIFQLKGWQVTQASGRLPAAGPGAALGRAGARTSAGRPTCAEFGPGATAGPRWRW